ncbi:MAG: YncE family protein [Acidobacteriota bacterium]|nr:YncE family protein [Acidobacteriota bacterium]
MRMAAAAVLAACVGMVAGCGNSYRPVLATIGAIGPAGQPTKYAVAVSTPTPPGNPCPLPGQLTSNGLLTMVDFSGDTVLVTAQLGVNPYYFALSASGNTGYTLNCDKTLNSFDISTSLISSQILESTLPPGSNPVSVFTNSNSTYLADPGVLAVDQLSSTPPALKQELPAPSGYSPLYVVGLSNAARAYGINQAINGGPGAVSAIETGLNTISATLPVGRGPVYGVMSSDTRRAFILNQGDNTVSVINVQNNALDTVSSIPVGTRPVWADLAPGLDELVVANEGPVFPITSYSISSNVITVKTGPQSVTAGQSVTLSGFPQSKFLNGQVVVVSATGLASNTFQAPLTHANVAALSEPAQGFTGNGTTPGSVTIINIPLCAVTALPNNPNCNAANPVDAINFGTVQATVPVGVNPIMVSVLSDFSRAYVANAGLAGLPCAANGIAVAGVSTTCTISVVNLLSNTVTATIPINGHPVYIATTNSTPTGKVYVVCNDSQVMTVIETDTDSLDTTIPLQGYGVSVRMTQP